MLSLLSVLGWEVAVGHRPTCWLPEARPYLRSGIIKATSKKADKDSKCIAPTLTELSSTLPERTRNTRWPCYGSLMLSWVPRSTSHWTINPNFTCQASLDVDLIVLAFSWAYYPILLTNKRKIENIHRNAVCGSGFPRLQHRVTDLANSHRACVLMRLMLSLSQALHELAVNGENVSLLKWIYPHWLAAFVTWADQQWHTL